MSPTKCKNCNCDCHCSLKEHGDMYGLCTCMNCEHEECEVCQQIKQSVVKRTRKKKKNLENVARQIKSGITRTILALKITVNHKRIKMNKLFLVLALLFALSACSVGKKCTYTQDGTKISSWVWFFNGQPFDLDKNNCTQEFMEIDEVFIYVFNADTIGVCDKSCSRIHPV